MSVLTKFRRIISNYRSFDVIPLAALKLEKAATKSSFYQKVKSDFIHGGNRCRLNHNFPDSRPLVHLYLAITLTNENRVLCLQLARSGRSIGGKIGKNREESGGTGRNRGREVYKREGHEIPSTPVRGNELRSCPNCNRYVCKGNRDPLIPPSSCTIKLPFLPLSDRLSVEFVSRQNCHVYGVYTRTWRKNREAKKPRESETAASGSARRRIRIEGPR